MTTQHNQEEKKFTLSPQAAEFVPRFLQSNASQSSLVQSAAAESKVLLSSVIYIILRRLVTFGYFNFE